MTRKTIPVERVKELANGMLLNSQDEMTKEREGIYTLLEQVLMDTGNYHGFRYLPGAYDLIESMPPVKELRDETRRQYY